MKIAAYALSAALLGMMSVMPASAASVVPSQAGVAVQSQGIVLAQYSPQKKKYYGNKPYGKKHYGKHNYRPGGRYSKAPRGWKRHYKRPSYWQTRGCIVVGPVWFCP